MELKVLWDNTTKLVEYMQQHNYSQHYIERHLQMSGSIMKYSGQYGWHSFQDVIQWYQQQNYTKSYLADVKKVVSNIKFYHIHGCFPGEGKIRRELLYSHPSLGKLDMSYLQDHLDELLVFMKNNDYKEHYLRGLRFTANRIIALSRKIKWDSYTEIFSWYQSQNLKSSYLQKIRAFLGILEGFHIRGEMPDNRETQNILCLRANNYSKLIPPFRKLVDYFVYASDKSGLCKSTVNSYISVVSSFLLAMQNSGAKCLGEISREMILSYFDQAEHFSTGRGVAPRLRRFFQVCIPMDEDCFRIRTEIPPIHSCRKNIQYITTEEANAFRNALKDMDNGLTYKSRAIGSILFYTGVRSSDVINLTLEAINLQSKTISFIQKKTGQPLILPLPTAVGNAIYDYCMFERPVTDSTNLFVGNQAPHHAVGTGSVSIAVSNILTAAGIRQEKGDRKGSHIFRHRAATTMMENNISPAVISATLGHSSPESLDPYLYADMAHLRECALSLSLFPLNEEVFQYV